MTQHIKQKGEGVYIVVEAEGDLTQHPSILDHPESFEIVDGEPPAVYDKLIYTSPQE